MSQQGALGVKKTTGILGCMEKNVPSRLMGVILPLSSTLLRAHLECCVQFWAAKCRKEKELSEQVQWRRAVKMRKGMEYLSDEERLRELGLSSGEETTERGTCQSIQINTPRAGARRMGPDSF
ncbi:hypothetical protein BTVI_146130 [Pitangus sulphuratus]|nr:hypothetical protein BTVI_146130 [Pitangus sulphuratus]